MIVDNVVPVIIVDDAFVATARVVNVRWLIELRQAVRFVQCTLTVTQYIVQSMVFDLHRVRRRLSMDGAHKLTVHQDIIVTVVCDEAGRVDGRQESRGGERPSFVSTGREDTR